MIMFCVFHVIECFDELKPQCEFFDNLIEALNRSNALRDMNCRFVSLVSEIEGNTTKMGATGLESHQYEWKKRR
jgi:hypothetical protein